MTMSDFSYLDTFSFSFDTQDVNIRNLFEFSDFYIVHTYLIRCAYVFLAI